MKWISRWLGGKSDKPEREPYITREWQLHNASGTPEIKITLKGRKNDDKATVTMTHTDGRQVDEKLAHYITQEFDKASQALGVLYSMSNAYIEKHYRDIRKANAYTSNDSTEEETDLFALFAKVVSTGVEAINNEIRVSQDTLEDAAAKESGRAQGRYRYQNERFEAAQMTRQAAPFAQAAADMLQQEMREAGGMLVLTAENTPDIHAAFQRLLPNDPFQRTEASRRAAPFAQAVEATLRQAIDEADGTLVLTADSLPDLLETIQEACRDVAYRTLP